MGFSNQIEVWVNAAVEVLYPVRYRALHLKAVLAGR